MMQEICYDHHLWLRDFDQGHCLPFYPIYAVYGWRLLGKVEKIHGSEICLFVCLCDLLCFFCCTLVTLETWFKAMYMHTLNQKVLCRWFREVIKSQIRTMDREKIWSRQVIEDECTERPITLTISDPQ